MRPIDDRDIRSCLINCSKGDARRLTTPVDLPTLTWSDLDFLGWRDPKAPQRAYLVAEHDDGLVGVALRPAAAYAGRARRSMCALCLTVHPGDGVTLMTAARPNNQGSSVGLYVCDDLACSLYLRGHRPVERSVRMAESLSVDERCARLRTNVAAFLDRVRE